MPDGFRIPEGEVRLWWASLELTEPEVSRMRELLDDRERRRADRFRVRHAARRFVVARAALRIVLGRLTGTEPARLDFVYGKNGKPFLVGGGPRFNSSDSGDTVVIAAARAELGVDVEILRTLPNRERLAGRICTARELELLAAYPEAGHGLLIPVDADGRDGPPLTSAPGFFPDLVRWLQVTARAK